MSHRTHAWVSFIVGIVACGGSQSINTSSRAELDAAAPFLPQASADAELDAAAPPPLQVSADAELDAGVVAPSPPQAFADAELDAAAPPPSKAFTDAELDAGVVAPSPPQAFTDAELDAVPLEASADAARAVWCNGHCIAWCQSCSVPGTVCRPADAPCGATCATVQACKYMWGL